MSSRLSIRLLLWAALVIFCAVGQVYLPIIDISVAGNVTLFQLVLLVTVITGLPTLLRHARTSEVGVTRTLSRVVLVYMLFELLVVIPVAVWLDRASLNTIVGEMTVRATWFLFPVMVTLCADERGRRWAGVLAALVAVGLVGWGAYSYVTGGGGYYIEDGELRFRILHGGAATLVAWPFALATSGAVRARATTVFLIASGIGLVLTNHRSDLIAFAVAGAAVLTMSGQYRRVLIAAVPTALVAVIVAIVAGRQLSVMLAYTLSNTFNASTGTGADRLMKWRMAWDFIAAHPVNDYVWSWTDGLPPTTSSAHNFLLEIASLEGVAGVAFYAAVLWHPFRKALVFIRRDAELRAVIGWLLWYVTFSLLNANHYLPTNMPLLVGAIAALAVRLDMLRTQESTPSPSYPAMESPA